MSVINTTDDILKEMSEVEQCQDITEKLRFLIKRRNTLSQRLGISGDSFTIRILEEAISALKAQEPKYPIQKQVKHGWFFYCSKCETILNDMATPKYCSECGQAVKWK